MRAAGPGDENALEELLLEVFATSGEPAPSPDRLRALVARSACGDVGLAFLVAESDRGDLIGLVSLAPTPTTLDAGEFVYLDDLYVRPEARRRGVASALLDAAKSWARERGAGEIRLASDSSDDATWNLYRSAGFEREPMHWMIVRLGRDWSGRRR